MATATKVDAVTEIVTPARFVLELSIEEAQALYTAIDADKAVRGSAAPAIFEALYNVGLRD